MWRKLPLPRFPAADWANEEDFERAERNRRNADLHHDRAERKLRERQARTADRLAMARVRAGILESEDDLTSLIQRIKDKQDEWNG